MENLFQNHGNSEEVVFFKADLEQENRRFKATVPQFQETIKCANCSWENWASGTETPVSLKTEAEVKHMTDEDVFGQVSIDEKKEEDVFSSVSSTPKPAPLQVEEDAAPDATEEKPAPVLTRKSKSVEFDEKRFIKAAELIEYKMKSMPDIDIPKIRKIIETLHAEESNIDVGCDEMAKMERLMSKLSKASWQLCFYESQLSEWLDRFKGLRVLATAIGWLSVEGGTAKDKDAVVTERLFDLLSQELDLSGVAKAIGPVRAELKAQYDKMSRTVTMRQMRISEMVRMNVPPEDQTKVLKTESSMWEIQPAAPVAETPVVTDAPKPAPVERPVSVKADQIKAKSPAVEIEGLDDFNEKPSRKSKASDPTTKDFDW